MKSEVVQNFEFYITENHWCCFRNEKFVEREKITISFDQLEKSRTVSQ